MIDWRFPILDDADREGINDPVITTFGGNHELSIARECIQNALDHRLDKEKPVQVVFNRYTRSSKDIPGLTRLSEIIKSCIDLNKDDKAQRVLGDAYQATKEPVANILVVSDYNTEGLNGSDEDENSNWCKLVRATGQNSPQGLKGGSYGLGKGAAFAASMIRTVFYSTWNEDDELVFQGKARLTSHKDEDDLKRGVGRYGLVTAKACNSVRDKSLIPEFLQRKEQGTDIIIPCYKPSSEKWDEGLLVSVLAHFWPAIHENLLEVKITDQNKQLHLVNSSNLPSLLEQYLSEETKYAFYFYQALVNPDKNGDFKKEFSELGTVKLYVKKGDNYPKKVQRMRSPHMVVDDPSYRTLFDKYAGVLICDDEEGNGFLSMLEPPEHNRWDPLLHATDITLARKVYGELNDWIKSCLRSMGEAEERSLLEIPGLDKYFQYEDDEQPSGDNSKGSNEPSGNEGGENEIPVSVQVLPAGAKRKYTIKTVSTQKGPEGGSSGTGNGKGKGGSQGSKKNKSGKGSRNDDYFLPVRILSCREKDSSTEYLVSIKPRGDFKGKLQILAAGEAGDAARLNIESSYDVKTKQPFKISGGYIEGINMVPDSTKLISVRIPGKNRYALGVRAYESS